MDKILAISTEDDPHIEMVQAHLTEEVYIYDPSKFPYDTDITYRFDGQRFNVQSEGRDFTSVKSVWFRKPKYLKAEDMPVDPDYALYAHDAYTHGVKGVYDLLRDKF